MTTSEIDGAHGLPRDIPNFTNEIQQVLHDLGKQRIGKVIKPQSEKIYSRRVIKHVNKEEEKNRGT